MNPLVEKLLVLQERDLRVAALTGELEKIPRQLEAAENELEARREKFDELKNTTRLIETERKRLDLDVQTKQATIVRYKAQQLQTRKNEEFAALNHEIAHAQSEISAVEDRELELMEAYDRGLVTVNEGQKELAMFEEKARQRKAELEKRSGVVAADLAAVKTKQAEAEALVPEDDLGRYRRILKSKKDSALVPIDHGSCGGCHMKLTSQTVLSARGSEGLTSCENCGRLVFWND